MSRGTKKACEGEKIMKIMAVILLIIGFILSALGGYGYFFSEDEAQCQNATSRAAAKLNEARAAQGTAREAALTEDARMEVNSQEFWCRNFKRTRQQAMLVGGGGIVAVAVGIVLLFISRKRLS